MIHDVHTQMYQMQINVHIWQWKPGRQAVLASLAGRARSDGLLLCTSAAAVLRLAPIHGQSMMTRVWPICDISSTLIRQHALQHTTSAAAARHRHVQGVGMCGVCGHVGMWVAYLHEHAGAGTLLGASLTPAQQPAIHRHQPAAPCGGYAHHTPH